MTCRRFPGIEDIGSFLNVSDVQLSPDGKTVAFVVGDLFLADGNLPKSKIWTVSSTGEKARPVIADPCSETSPRWSPDGQFLAFLSDRDKTGVWQLYLLPKTGSEIRRLDQIKGSIPTTRSLNSLQWSADSQSIYFLMTDPISKYEKVCQQQKDDSVEFEKHPKYTRLYNTSIRSGKTRCISPESLQIWEFSAASSGKKFAVVSSPLPFEQSWYTSNLTVIGDGYNSPITLYSGPRQSSTPTWSPDGRLVAFLSSNWSDRGLIGGGIFVVSASGGEIRELASQQEASFSWIEWLRNGKGLLAASHEWGYMALSEIELISGTQHRLWHGSAMLTEPNWPKFSSDSAGNIAVVREDSRHPRQVWLGKRSGNELEWFQLTDFHGQDQNLILGSLKSVQWRGADGWEMQGFVLLPPKYDPKKPPPLVTNVHGGPTFTYGFEFYANNRWFHQLTAEGIAIFLPNPRGSTGRGLAFAESNMGDMGGKDWEDIERGIDALIDRGFANPERLGISGNSYGGFMTAWAITRTDRFHAAVMLAGISDWRSFHGRSYLCDWDVIHYGGSDPWDPDGIFRHRSPITHVKNVDTPTLILHGEQDLDVPVEQGHFFYRALKDLGVETELVIYPREPHDIQEIGHVLDLNRRIIDWFKMHLLAGE